MFLLATLAQPQRPLSLAARRAVPFSRLFSGAYLCYNNRNAII
jgi:hypothetical protein